MSTEIIDLEFDINEYILKLLFLRQYSFFVGGKFECVLGPF